MEKCSFQALILMEMLLPKKLVQGAAVEKVDTGG